MLEGERQGTSATDNEPEWRQPYKKNARKPGALQEILVGAKGFEPSTPRSRTELERAYVRMKSPYSRGAGAQKVLIAARGVTSSR